MSRAKIEADLSTSIKKAVNIDETAPKEKHVQKCIDYTWNFHTSLPIWTGLRVQPILADEVQTFKALILAFTILQKGDPMTIKEANGQTGWFETCARTVDKPLTYASSISTAGYASQIRNYVSFILSKLQFHRIHPEFNGLYRCTDHVSLKGDSDYDLNEAYELAAEMMNIQSQIDLLWRLIFTNFRGRGSNECRIAALAPLMRDSLGIYYFATSLLHTMHLTTSSSELEALEPLRQKYNTQYSGLYKFCQECSGLPFLATLVDIPALNEKPCNFLDIARYAPGRQLLIEAPDDPDATSGRHVQGRHARPPQQVALTQGAFTTTIAEPFTTTTNEPSRAAVNAYSGTESSTSARKNSRLSSFNPFTSAVVAPQPTAEPTQIFGQTPVLASPYSPSQPQVVQPPQQLVLPPPGYIAQPQQGVGQPQQVVVGQPPQIVAQPPQFVGPPPQVVSGQPLRQFIAGGPGGTWPDARIKDLEAEVRRKDLKIQEHDDQNNQLKTKYEALGKLYMQLRQEHLDVLEKMKSQAERPLPQTPQTDEEQRLAHS